MLVPVTRPNEPEPAPRDPRDAVDVNAVVSYNLRIAREQNGWTQEQFADRLEGCHRPQDQPRRVSPPWSEHGRAEGTESSMPRNSSTSPWP